MEPMDFRSTCIVILIAIAFAGTIIWRIVEWGKAFKAKRELEQFEYDTFYVWLQDCIKKYSIHKDNYNYLKAKIIELSELKYKDSERTDVLTANLRRRFARFAADDCDSVFMENDIF
jgi:hypothetical protein